MDIELELLRGRCRLRVRGSHPSAPPMSSQALTVVERYREHDIGLTDASIVVLAGRYGTDRVLTLDERHFRTLRTPAGKPFTILPADA